MLIIRLINPQRAGLHWTAWGPYNRPQVRDGAGHDTLLSYGI